MKVLVLNGPNLNMLGLRETDLYGKQDYNALCEKINNKAKELNIDVIIKQSNYEGELITWIQEAYGKFNGIIINPAAYTHTSIAIMDALKAINIPTIEVHLTDIHSREAYRQHSFIKEACEAQIFGKGFDSYIEALELLKVKFK